MGSAVAAVTQKPQPGAAPSRRSGVVLRAYLALFALLATVYIGSGDPPRFLWTAMGVLGVAAMVVGVRRHRPRRRLPWTLATGGVAALAVGDTMYDVLQAFFGDVNPFPSPADAVYLTMYPLLALGMVRFIRCTSPSKDRQALLDAAIVTVALGLLVWVFLAPPALGGQTSYVVTRGVSMQPVFHTGDLALVRQRNAYEVGDVIAYRSPTLDVVVLHRIHSGDSHGFRTKGDNNSWVDPGAIPADQVIGKLWLHVPRVGSYVHTGTLVPATLHLGAVGRWGWYRFCRYHAADLRAYSS